MSRLTPVSGIALLTMGAGGAILYSGLRNATVADTVRSLLKGESVPSSGSTLAQADQAAVQQLTAIGGAGSQAAAGGAAAAVGAAVNAPSDLGARIVAGAEAQLGKPYVFGAAGPDSFDCSGLVSFVLRQLGALDRRLVTGQFYVWSGASTVSRPPRPGDLICWTGHIGIATSATEMIHAPGVGRKVQRTTIWWTGSPLVRRVKGA